MGLKETFLYTEVEDRYGNTSLKLKVSNCFTTFVGSILGISLFFGSFYVVSEGNMGVIRSFGKVVGDASPGLHFKIPFVQSVQHIDIQPRKYQINLQASTTGKTKEGAVELQMPSVITITGNYSVNISEVKEIVSVYGSIQQFDDRILDPRVKQAALSEVPKYTIEQIMTNRTELSRAIAISTSDSLDEFPVTFTDIMVSNVDWHPKIKDAVLNKQNAKLAKEQEQHALDKQNLEAQRDVNTAKAKAESIGLIASAEALATVLKGEAEAKAIRAKGKALKQNPNLIQLVHEERWNGSLVTTNLGTDTKILMKLNQDR